MTFEVKYRNKQGATEYLRVDAGSRSEVFAILKERGIPSVIQVVDVTGKKPRKAATTGAPISGKIKGLMALVAVCVIGVVAYLLVVSGEEQPIISEPKIEKPKTIEMVKPDFVRPAVETASVAAVEVQKPAPLETWNGHEIVSKKVVTNGVNIVVTMVGADGKVYKQLKKTTKPIFDNPVDQMLAMVMDVPPGGSLPPMPSLGRNSGDVFAEALKKPIVINDDDSERVKRAKLLVQAGREAMLDELRRGKTVEEVFADHCRAVNDNAALHAEAKSGYRKLLEEGDAEGAEHYRQEANKILENAGADIVPEYGTTRRTKKGLTE